jgi:hypothetical protein
VPKLSDNEIRAIVGKRLSDAMGASNTELNVEREKALNFYFGRPLGNEIEGRSQVVSKDMMDTIEWIMPSLMRVFTIKSAVQFDPVGPEDEELARQESEYVSHVLWKKNPGFMLIYTWLKDALMCKVSYVKYWWDESEKVTVRRYTGLNPDELALLMQDLNQGAEAEITESEQDENGYWNCKVRITTETGCARIEAIPPEEVLVSSDCKGNAKDAKFVGSIRRVTRSDLMEMGYSRKVVDEINDYVVSASNNVAMARDTVNENAERSDEGVDWATKELQLLECYTYVDVDDDGIAELRHFLMGGDTILENEEFDDIPIVSWTPVPLPHRHAGLSMYDLVEDLQRIHTALERSLLDNAYFGNNQRIIYDKNTVNLGMLQVNRPGGHIANDGPVAGSFAQLPVADIATRLLPVIQHVQQLRERRTGVGDMTTGIDADTLAQATKGAYMDAKGAANQRIEAIARIFAETGLAALYGSLHKLLMKHQDWPERFRLRQQWVTANPSEWQERANLTISVGLGTAGREEVRTNLMAMASAQQQAAQSQGLIQPANVHALFTRIQAELGFENENFITDPASQEYQQYIQQMSQTPPDPYVEGAKIKAQVDSEKAKLDATNKALDRAQERDLTITKLEVESGVDLAKAGIGAEVALSRGNPAAGAVGAGAAGQRPVSGGFGGA